MLSSALLVDAFVGLPAKAPWRSRPSTPMARAERRDAGAVPALVMYRSADSLGALAVVIAFLLFLLHSFSNVPPAFAWGDQPEIREAAVPDLIHSNISTRRFPLWVSARMAAEGSDRLGEDLFHPTDLEQLRKHATANRPPESSPDKMPSPCRETFGPPIVERIEPKPNRTLHDLVEHSLLIVSGQVAAVELGFFDGLPYSLLRVKAHRFLSTEGSSTFEEEVYLAYPFAQFQLSGERYCMGLSEQHRPAVGDRVVAFLFEPSLDDHILFFAPELEEMAFETDTLN